MWWWGMMDHNHVDVFWAVLPRHLHDWAWAGVRIARSWDKQSKASLSRPNLLYSQVNQTISVTIKYKRWAGTEINYPWNHFVLSESRFREYGIKLHKVENTNNWWHGQIRRWTVNCHLLKCVPCIEYVPPDPSSSVHHLQPSLIKHRAAAAASSKAQDGVDREPGA